MPDPNNIILREHGLIFMCIPKAANTSIKMALQQALGLRGDPHRVFETCDKLEAKVFDGEKIAFTRNPVDRLRSCYIDKVCRAPFPAFIRRGIPHGASFDEFIDHVCETPDQDADQHFRAQSYDLMIDDTMVPTFVGSVENIDVEWATVQEMCEKRGLHGVPSLPHANRTDADFHIPDNTLARIRQRYAEDFKAFGYE